MKLIKTLGITAVAAIISMAFLSPAASADSTHIVLCKKAILECTGAADQFPNPTTITAHAVDPQLLTNFGTVLCPESHAKIELLNTLSETLITHLTELTFSGQCKLAMFFNCTVTVTILGLLFFIKTGALSAKVQSDGTTAAHVVCAGGTMNCTFGGKPALTASSTAAGVTTLVANEAELTKTGTPCPSTSKLDTTYTALGTMWIES